MLLQSRVDYRALEGFLLAVSTFNFTAIGGNLPGETFTGGHIFKLFDLPDSRGGRRLIQFVPGPPPEVVAPVISHLSFRALHITGSTSVFKKPWKDIATYLDEYKGYPRLVGKTGGEELSCHPQVGRDLQCSFAVHLGRLRVSRLRTVTEQYHRGRLAYDKITGFIQKAKDTGEMFLLEASVYVYDDADYEKTLELVDNTSPYALIRLHVAAQALPAMSIITRDALTRSWVNNLVEEHEQVGPTTKLGASASSTDSFRQVA
ncbi:hypothetical protein EDB19DRAFT_2030145 [Suillus lakei]|nr:hypothetical protein EDB19DRAFT_2030145 [Suillus lakei]